MVLPTRVPVQVAAKSVTSVVPWAPKELTSCLPGGCLHATATGREDGISVFAKQKL
jgi:hypothetical protein